MPILQSTSVDLIDEHAIYSRVMLAVVERFWTNPYKISPLKPLKKGGTRSEVPLLKGDLGGSS